MITINNEWGIPSGLHRRKVYLERIAPFIGQNLIKVFTGQRRVGKSYILYQIMQLLQKQEKKASIIYINKEDLAFDHLLTAKDLHEYVTSLMKKDRMNYVFIDEIQEIQSFEKALRSLLLKGNCDIYCTGSNAELLSGEFAHLLSGRYVEITIYSLSYPEFLHFHHLQDSDESLNHYFRYGGLPYLIHLPQEDAVLMEYLRSVYTTIVFRDVIDRYGVRSIQLLERLLRFLADNTGSLFSAKKISDYLKSQHINLAPNQIQLFIGYLANAFIIHHIERYDIGGKKLFETGGKNYFENTGIRHAVIGYRPQDLGKVLENVVLNHLLFKGWNVKTGVIPSGEIDFVCRKNQKNMYIQVALDLKGDNTIEREFGNLMKIKDLYPRKVITLDAFKGASFQGIEHLNVHEFLLGE